MDLYSYFQTVIATALEFDLQAITSKKLGASFSMHSRKPCSFRTDISHHLTVRDNKISLGGKEDRVDGHRNRRVDHLIV